MFNLKVFLFTCHKYDTSIPCIGSPTCLSGYRMAYIVSLLMLIVQRRALGEYLELLCAVGDLVGVGSYVSISADPL
jgi:hypothetical protein